MTKEINLTPNFGALYERFKAEAMTQSSVLFRDMPEMDCAEMQEKRDAYRAVQAVLAPIAICLNSAATAEQINDMRGWINDIVKDTQAKGDRLDNELYQRDEDSEDDSQAEPTEPEECDWITEDHKTFVEHGSPRVRFDVEPDIDWRISVNYRMDKDQFWPNVWSLSDHGNWCLLDASLSAKFVFDRVAEVLDVWHGGDATDQARYVQITQWPGVPGSAWGDATHEFWGSAEGRVLLYMVEGLWGEA